ncbi:MAG TPA: hypothetical protein VKR58_04295 [Aquella sp.]|nr:hypothetical protein [Aquella sp.]
MSVADFPTQENIVQDLPTVPTVPSVSSENLESQKADTNGHVSEGVGSFDMNLSLVDNMLLLKGASTRQYISNLKSLGGHWTPTIRAWVFDAKYQKDVQVFVSGVATGKIKPDPAFGFAPKKKQFRSKHQEYHETSGPMPAYGLLVQKEPKEDSNFDSSEGGLMLPTVNSAQLYFQRIEYRSVFLPKVGMIAKIKSDGNIISLPVVRTELNPDNGKVDLAYVSNGNKLTCLQVARGRWEVRGYAPKHNIFFEKQ